ncbi:hypothetical protein PDESU_03688 [Pontiella desulfatans]|uniref:Uncharacterized protein n=1 Tax=Pontiella desulfatans TaxID=2750659 RepID=A0A6C2U4W8_PONDE|nr:hypothetical protein [Pontiella desulfatans]VGO15108.1 hypothetical protein PDESU_03688 [Pontiella desulfatans]
MKIQGIKLWLEPDHLIPVFLRLRAQAVEVPVADVLLKGIHPESAIGLGGDWCQAGELLAQTLNRERFRFDPLSVHRLNADIVPLKDGFHHDRRTGLQRGIDSVCGSVYFAEQADYSLILKKAVERLRDHWRNDVAWNLLRANGGRFSEMRTFLKKKHPDLALRSYDDMNALFLSELLSVNDFLDQEQSLISEALACMNFRRASAISEITDDQGRLRFANRIEWFELLVNPRCLPNSGLVKYACEVRGNFVHFTPELGFETSQRRFAKQFAQKYRTAGGDYCFAMPVSELQELLNREEVSVKFSNVRYLQRLKCLRTTARLRKEKIPRFGISWRKMETLEQFRDALRVHGAKISGTKSQLIKRTAQLAAERYDAVTEELSGWFAENPFVRVPKEQNFAEPFPLLTDDPLKDLLLSMFLMRHLRGNTVVDVNHENQSVQPEDMAEALLNGKAKLSGCFIKA